MSDVLDQFGKMFIENVRDRTIESFDQMLNGTMKGITAQKVQEKIRTFDQAQMDAVAWLIPQVVDLCLNNMLWLAEQEEELNILYQGTALREESDGLSGELYTEDGWIQRYSTQRYDEI